VATGDWDIENRGLHGLGVEFLHLNGPGRAGPDGPKNFASCRPLIQNKQKSLIKEEIEISFFYPVNAVKVQNTQQQA